ncbi:hypothetical protein PVAND_009253 [Polypedilum vanderplanki]|uniref:Cathepsin propeptide inhibitor domain-containing protein n=1 Tax=Polypedilum vanderplanki TaxID=319348 RepID=A0A9J6CCJ7_POLVA|nr:hypothetical protein PVAND_009253 [Polypedilum vanderplanki]
MKFFCIYILVGLIALNYGLNDEEEWKQYKAKFNKQYNETEDARRFQLFKTTLEENAKQNEKFLKGESTWQAGLNKFSDWTLEEKRHLSGLAVPLPSSAATFA